MDISNMRRTISVLESVEDRKFDIRSVFSGRAAAPSGRAKALETDCGSAACVAGWAGVAACTPVTGMALLRRMLGKSDPLDRWSMERAGAWLGLSDTDANLLFLPFSLSEPCADFTRLRAIATLTRMVEVYEATGYVSVPWADFNPDGTERPRP